MVEAKCKTAQIIIPNATRWNFYYNAVEKLHSIVTKNKFESLLNDIRESAGVATFRAHEVTFIGEYCE